MAVALLRPHPLRNGKAGGHARAPAHELRPRDPGIGLWQVQVRQRPVLLSVNRARGAFPAGWGDNAVMPEKDRGWARG